MAQIAKISTMAKNQTYTFHMYFHMHFHLQKDSSSVNNNIDTMQTLLTVIIKKSLSLGYL